MRILHFISGPATAVPRIFNRCLVVYGRAMYGLDGAQVFRIRRMDHSRAAGGAGTVRRR